MPTFPKKKVSAGREKLAAITAEKASVEARLAEINASASRLNEASHAAEAASNALARIDSDSAAEMAAWAQTGDGPIPQPPADAREQALRDLAQAQAQAGAAEAARAGINAKAVKEHETLAWLAGCLNAAVAEIMAEEIDELAAAAAAVAIDLKTRHEQIIQGCELIQTFKAGTTGELLGEITAIGGRANSAMERAFNTSVESDRDRTAVTRTAWWDFDRDIRSDQGVRLNVAPEGK